MNKPSVMKGMPQAPTRKRKLTAFASSIVDNLMSIEEGYSFFVECRDDKNKMTDYALIRNHATEILGKGNFKTAYRTEDGVTGYRVLRKVGE